MSLSKHTLWNVVGNVFPLVIGAVTIPLLVQRLGLERFGILTLLWTIVGYFSLFDFGVGRAITQRVATLIGDGKPAEIAEVIKAGLEFTIWTGAVGTVVLLLAAYPLSHHGLGVSTGLQQEVFISLAIAAVGIPLATLSTGLRGALEGYENFQASNIARMFLGATIFLFPFLAVLLHGPSLITITVWLVLARLVSCVFFLWLTLKLPSRNFWKEKVRKETRKHLFSFGAWMAITNLISPLLVNIDRFIISYLLGAAVVAYYTLPFEFLVRLLILPGALGASLLPNLARFNAIDAQRANKTFVDGVKITAAVMFAVCTAAALLAYPLLKIFISANFAEQSIVICVILAFGVFVNGVAYIPYTALHARGSAKPTGLLHLAEFFVYIPVLLIFVRYMGLTGAAIAWSLRASCDAAALFWLYRAKGGFRVLA